ncbi:ribulose-bisphosphate carboxylase large subunit family protein [Pseudomonas putida]|mgnify:FL=1|uniref:ribulose-bisphosphate carboxylase large subunit family protein n=1 Tax=Pseudomonas putida TaxID=303 RepID=UPI00031FCEA0|nr:ribulose-bisphosphate carboxylase large subunit family protein [Pseudomonas putida]ANC80415.1 ribulose 1,5-bisphosphate carboxylase [Pseudomonas putida B6-2]TRO39238.1 ribulose 1,5-bisphosphate carboxylase [Pseudomonas putida]ULL06052.1 ribulose-bisphosphate carboxylase large subunit family protein [Pseudomonas putida]
MVDHKAGREEFTARFFVESSYPIERVSEVIAGEQSSGTFLSLPGESAELKERSRARVVAIEPLASVSSPSLHSDYLARHNPSETYHRGEVTIAFPTANIGTNIPALLTTIAGNLFEIGEVSGLRVLDLELPERFASGFIGPQFGIEGTRALAGVHDRPIIGTIVKPSIGLTPEQTASVVDELCAGGIDFIKDDELLIDPTYASFDARLSAVMPVLHKHADRLGRMPMYAINISGSIDEMMRRQDAVLEAGGTCVMLCLNWVGHSAVEHIRKHAQLPIHGHRNGWGALTRYPQLGFSFEVYQKIWRLAGIDHLHVNGIQGKFYEADDSVISSAKSCLAPFAGMRPLMPVFSSGQWAGQAPELFNRLQSVDLMHLAGGGIIGHPMGIEAGVQSMREGWEAAVQHVPLERYAEGRPALSAALQKFGGK